MLGLRKLPGPSQNMSKISQATHIENLLTSFPVSCHFSKSAKNRDKKLNAKRNNNEFLGTNILKFPFKTFNSKYNFVNFHVQAAD